MSVTVEQLISALLTGVSESSLQNLLKAADVRDDNIAVSLKTHEGMPAAHCVTVHGRNRLEKYGIIELVTNIINLHFTEKKYW